MRSTIILCIILSGQQISRAQLNYEGNPLTENTEYKAEESHVSGRNVRQDYQRFEVADGRTVSASTSPFALSPAGDIVTLHKQHSHTSNDTRKEEQLSSTTTNRSQLKADRVTNIRSPDVSSEVHISKSETNEPRILEISSENLRKASESQTVVQASVESRHLGQPQRHLPYESAPSQISYKSPEQSTGHAKSDPTWQLRNANAHNSLAESPVTPASIESRHLGEYSYQPQRPLPHESASSQNSYKPPEQSTIHAKSDPTWQLRNANAHNSLAESPVTPTPIEARHIGEYPHQPQRPLPHESASSQNSYKPPEQSTIHAKSDPTWQLRNVNAHNSLAESPVIPAPIEARHIGEYPHQPQRHLPYESASSQNSYKPPERSKVYANAHNSLAESPVTSASGQALNEFLNSRTPEESQMALQQYLTIREQAARGRLQGSEPLDRIQQVQSAPEVNNVQTEWGVDSSTLLLNGHPNDEYLAYQRQENANAQRQHLLSGVVPSKVVQDETGLTSYSPGQQHALPRGDNLDLQLRQNMQPFLGPGRQRPRYRGQFPGRFRGRHWAQSRIDPRPFAYHHKGPIYGGPPGPPPGYVGKFKPPVEVIYTRPPGFGHGPSPPSNPPVPYEDASHWFPDADEPPPHKDVYYSQLYQQSYDPHYYNYIAKTGKIKPWLYGKLGKHEEKSIWWELFAGFKKHGMKNMMNPMFLLGMTIPTLTIMLTALVQKRSLGRSDSAGHVTEEVIDELVERIQQHIACYERQIKNYEGSEEKCW